MNLKNSVIASNELAAEFKEYNKDLGAAYADVASLKEQMVHVDTNKNDSEKVTAVVPKESEQRGMR